MTAWVLAATTAALAGCGGAGDKPQPEEPKGTPDPAAARIAQRYVDAYTARNAGKICNLLASEVREQLSVKHPCVETVKKTLKQPFPKFTVDRSYAAGDRAIVTFKASPRRVTLERENGSWKVIDGGT